MSRGVNKVILVGNLGSDPETVNIASGALTKFTLATGSSYKNKSGEVVNETEWHRIVIFGTLAEIAAKYLKKGSPVYIEGKIKTSKYDKDGETRYSTDIIAHEMNMLANNDSKPNSDVPF